MRNPLTAFVVLMILSAEVASAQSVSPAQPVDGRELLKRVAQHYADAKSYSIQSVEERTQDGEFSRYWNKTVLAAAEAPGNRFYFGGQANNGRGVRVSDGKTVWTYHIDEHRYTARPWTGPSPERMGIIPMQEVPIMQAEDLRKSLQRIAHNLKSVDGLPDETLMVDGHPVACHVVHVQTADEKRVQNGDSFERTIWIDRDQETVLKMVERNRGIFAMGVARLPTASVTTTWYSNTVLDRAVPESLFTFAPPSDAKLIAQFHDPMDGNGASMMGEEAPPVKLKSADGKEVSLESLKGKPVLLDLWATWCAPCVAGLPSLAQIYEEARDKGLVLLAVDEDEDSGTAQAFLTKRSYNWPDYHDEGGEIQKLLGPAGLPWMVLVDAQGVIVFDGWDENKLRAHIASLGPEYASLAPKPKPSPCNVTQ